LDGVRILNHRNARPNGPASHKNAGWRNLAPLNRPTCGTIDFSTLRFDGFYFICARCVFNGQQKRHSSTWSKLEQIFLDTVMKTPLVVGSTLALHDATKSDLMHFTALGCTLLHSAARTD
jgi:hypothetical protein